MHHASSGRADADQASARQALYLTPQDRVALCHAVDFPRFLEVELGVELVREGVMYACRSPLRSERTPSCMVYPPGIGKMGARGWTFCDYGGGAMESGDALGLAIAALSLSFTEAAYRLAQYTANPRSWGATTREAAVSAPRPAVSHQPVVNIPVDMQRLAMRALIAAIEQEVPNAAEAGELYQRSRGASPAAIELMGTAYRIPSSAAAQAIARRLQTDPAITDAAWRSGLIYFLDRSPQRGGSLLWERDGDIVLFPCLARDGVTPFYATARRCHWQASDTGPKYRAQNLRHGAQRAPYGLPSLAAAAAAQAPLIICEGPTDALGAVTLGIHAIAMLCRPNAYGDDDMESPAARQLSWLLTDLRACSEVIVLPDNDAEGEKVLVGQACGRRLVNWLAERGVNARLGSMADFGLQAWKDLADAAAAAADQTHHR